MLPFLLCCFADLLLGVNGQRKRDPGGPVVAHSTVKWNGYRASALGSRKQKIAQFNEVHQALDGGLGTASAAETAVEPVRAGEQSGV
jgi:hypothetical protein